jgi:hypothetical protein
MGRVRTPAAGEQTVLLRYDAAVDALTVHVGRADELDIDEVVEDMLVFFDAREAGRLVAVEVLSASLGRNPGWRAVARDYLGDTISAEYETLARAPVTVSGRDIALPRDEWEELAWRWLVGHRYARAKLGLEPLREPDRPGAALRAGQGCTIWAPVPRVGDAPAVAALPVELAEAAGVAPALEVRRVDSGVLELRAQLAAEEPRLEIEAATPAYGRARFERSGDLAVARLAAGAGDADLVARVARPASAGEVTAEAEAPWRRVREGAYQLVTGLRASIRPVVPIFRDLPRGLVAVPVVAGAARAEGPPPLATERLELASDELGITVVLALTARRAGRATLELEVLRAPAADVDVRVEDDAGAPLFARRTAPGARVSLELDEGEYRIVIAGALIVPLELAATPQEQP